MKLRSTFFTGENIERIRANSICSDIREQILERALVWKKPSYDGLWNMVFGSMIKRTDSVNTEGYCPVCGQAVDKYGWLFDAFSEPWKVWCPHCGERFPKNDFGRFYESGLDRHRVFKPELADRSLLFNVEAPDPDDPKHMFCVDDGNGYRRGNDIWIFIGYYICYGVWCKQIYEGIQTLAWAYLLTGDKDYAVRCCILLDRTADLFPAYDYYEQGYLMQELKVCRGYVTAWNVMIRQLFSLLLSYDAIFDAICDDDAFISYISDKSKTYQTPCRKETFADIQTNIENRIFADAMSHPWKTEANPPWPMMFDALVKMILTEWPSDPAEIPYNVYIIMWWMPERVLKKVIEDSTRIDGISGEKGFTSYSSIALEGTAKLLSWFSLYDRDIIEKMTAQYPGILEGLRFFINSWLLCSYYPGCGDTNTWMPIKSICINPGYANFGRDNMAETIFYSYEGFLWNLYLITKDINIIRYMYNSDNYDLDRLFSSDFTLGSSPENIRNEIRSLMLKHGSEIEQHCMNAERWKLAVLHSGCGNSKRAAYLDYDSGGVHGHNDCMNIGLYAKSINYLPDLGYPPVHRPGGWHSGFFYWYRSAASHNTAIVDGIEHRDFTWYQRDVKGGQGLYSETGKSVLWSVGNWVKAVAADNPEAAGAKRFERLLAVVDLSEKECYFFDIFRIKGGKEHVKLTHGGLDCCLYTSGLELEPHAAGYDPFGTAFIRDRNPSVNIPYTFDNSFRFVRNLRTDVHPRADWKAEWKYSYRYNKALRMPESCFPSLLYHDLTSDSVVTVFDSFLDSFGLVSQCYPDELKGRKGHPEIMRPGIAVKRSRKDEEDLESTFIGIYDTSVDGNYSVISSRRLPVDGSHDPDSGPAAFEVTTVSGTDLIIAGDLQDKKACYQKDWDVSTDADILILRRTNNNKYKLFLFNGSFFRFRGEVKRSGITKEIYEDEFHITGGK